MSLPTRLGVFLGGFPTGIAARVFKAAVNTEVSVIQTLGKALAGPDRVLVSICPTMTLKPGVLATDEDPVSSKLTQKWLGWQPMQPGLIADISCS